LIIEKAYAQYKGGYDKIATGGNPAEVMEALTGRPAYKTAPGFLDWGVGSDAGFNKLKQEFESGKGVIFSSPRNPGYYFTPPPGSSLDYGLVNQHAYTVTKMYTDENGKQWVELYNPWGTSHPKAVPYDEVKEQFRSVTVC